MEIIRLETTDQLYNDALDLRYELFFREPNLPREVLFDSLEDHSIHIACVLGGILCAYGRLSEVTPHIFKISQMVVRPRMQGKGLGTKVLETLTHIALDRGAQEIYLNARLHAVPMYERLGFKALGDSYVAERTGICHVRMSRCV